MTDDVVLDTPPDTSIMFPPDPRAAMEELTAQERADCLAAINAACEQYHCKLAVMAHFGETAVAIASVLAVPVSVQVVSK